MNDAIDLLNFKRTMFLVFKFLLSLKNLKSKHLIKPFKKPGFKFVPFNFLLYYIRKINCKFSKWNQNSGRMKIANM